MKAWVYRLRRAGKRLPGGQVLAKGPDYGELVFGCRLSGTRIMIAQLMREDSTYVIPCLNNALLLPIEANGMLLTGDEVIPRSRGSKSRADWRRQSWWIEFQPPVPIGDIALGAAYAALTEVCDSAENQRE